MYVRVTERFCGLPHAELLIVAAVANRTGGGVFGCIAPASSPVVLAVVADIAMNRGW